MSLWVNPGQIELTPSSLSQLFWVLSPFSKFQFLPLGSFFIIDEFLFALKEAGPHEKAQRKSRSKHGQAQTQLQESAGPFQACSVSNLIFF